MNKDLTPKCYNTFSCVSAILIIIFVLAALIWNTLIVCPQLQQSMQELSSDMKELKTLMKSQQTPVVVDSIELNDSIFIAPKDSVL